MSDLEALALSLGGQMCTDLMLCVPQGMISSTTIRHHYSGGGGVGGSGCTNPVLSDCSIFSAGIGGYGFGHAICHSGFGGGTSCVELVSRLVAVIAWQ